MSDPSTDDKIARLVHSVLEAVDLRLAEVRRDLQVVTHDVEQRHAELQHQLDDVARRVDRLAADVAAGTSGPGGTVDDRLGARMEQATQVLLERLESSQRRSAAATEERLAQLQAAIDHVQAPGASPAPAATAITTQIEVVPPLTPSRPSFAQVTAPLLPSSLTAHASPQPVVGVGGPAPAAAAPALGLPPLDAPTVVPGGDGSEDADGEQIDLDRLTDLLTQRLGQLNLPRPQ